MGPRARPRAASWTPSRNSGPGARPAHSRRVSRHAAPPWKESSGVRAGTTGLGLLPGRVRNGCICPAPSPGRARRSPARRSPTWAGWPSRARGMDGAAHGPRACSPPSSPADSRTFVALVRRASGRVARGTVSPTSPLPAVPTTAAITHGPIYGMPVPPGEVAGGGSAVFDPSTPFRETECERRADPQRTRCPPSPYWRPMFGLRAEVRFCLAAASISNQRPASSARRSIQHTSASRKDTIPPRRGRLSPVCAGLPLRRELKGHGR
jgi:hypothetical protein